MLAEAVRKWAACTAPVQGKQDFPAGHSFDIAVSISIHCNSIILFLSCKDLGLIPGTVREGLSKSKYSSIDNSSLALLYGPFKDFFVEIPESNLLATYSLLILPV